MGPLVLGGRGENGDPCMTDCFPRSMRTICVASQEYGDPLYGWPFFQECGTLLQAKTLLFVTFWLVWKVRLQIIPTSTTTCLWLPDSVPGTDDHYKPFGEVFHTTSTEEHHLPFRRKAHNEKSLPFLPQCSTCKEYRNDVNVWWALNVEQNVS